ncbi:hypothetical protein Hanom_Chr12g01102301 [Helianthus anomalus]
MKGRPLLKLCACLLYDAEKKRKRKRKGKGKKRGALFVCLFLFGLKRRSEERSDYARAQLYILSF